jgi:hypothetical protein
MTTLKDVERGLRDMKDQTLSRWQRPAPPSYPHTWHDDYVHSWTGPSRTEKKD